MRRQQNILFQLGKKKLLPPFFPHPISVTAMCYDLPYSLKGHLRKKRTKKKSNFQDEKKAKMEKES